MALGTTTTLIAIQTKGKVPSLPFALMAEVILGKKYELSIVFATKKESQTLNNQYRGKNYPTNVLSFPLSKYSGEIILHLPTAKKEAPNFGIPYADFVGYLFIHGLLHLKGFDHGSTMESIEARFRKQFGI
jgi:rRNA maturation RNase YbeY